MSKFSTNNIDSLAGECHKCGDKTWIHYDGHMICWPCLSDEKIKPMKTPSYMRPRIKEIKIKYFDDEITRLEYIDGKSDWIDLRAADTMHLEKGHHYLIPLGVAMQIPDGYEALVAPRSSSFKKWGVLQTNSIGVIDETYCGDNDQWFWTVYATKNTTINKNDRICQFRIIKHQPKIIFKEVSLLENPDRNGHGSTGHE